MAQYTMTIGGSARVSPEAFDVVNPATGEVFERAPECSKAQLEESMTGAAEAFLTWRLDEEARRGALVAAANAVEADIEALAAVLTAEQGKPLADARGEISSVSACLRYFAGLRVDREIVQNDKQAVAEMVRRPLGVVAAITPWNYPLILATYKIAPALLAGNTMVLKPSPYTPLSTLRMGEILRPVLPSGVLNVVSGGDQLGGWMTGHPIPRKITFTGSVATGKRVAAAAAQDLKRVTLELGGNDPAILLDDVDPQAIAERLFWTAFANSGQVCAAVKRVYAPEGLYDQVVEALAERARSTTVGDGAAPGTELGPLNNRPQLERVQDLVDDAVKAGARVATGGRAAPGPGYFFEPTVLADISDGTRIVDEEQFGPALPVLSYSDVDDAVARANSTHFGLGASVWSGDEERAAAIAAKLESGTVWINTHTTFGAHLPFGGLKWSGIGVENGTWGYYGFTEGQVIYRNRS